MVGGCERFAFLASYRRGAPLQKRKSLSQRTRFEIFKRDRFTCQYCGAHTPDVLLVIDHVIPIAEGGTNDTSNLRTACQPCNGGKSDRLLLEGEFPTPSARAVEEQAERLRQAKAYANLVQEMRAHDDDRVDIVIQAWAKAFQAQTVIKDGQRFWQFRAGEDFPSKASVRKVLKRLPLETVLDAVDIAAAKIGIATRDAERYFFGVCWRKVDELEAAPTADPPSPPAEPASPEPSDVEEDVEQTEWAPCTPFIGACEEPANYPDWWDHKRGPPPERWLESPVDMQRRWAWDDAHRRQEADPDAGEEPKPFWNDSLDEGTIRNPRWVRYWEKYGYPQEREYIGTLWGPEGVGNEACVHRPWVKDTSPAEEVRIANAFLARLKANARAPSAPFRVNTTEYHALIQALDTEDIFLDKGTSYIGMRVWIDDTVIAAIEAVCEAAYVATAYYVNADEWTPPGMSLAAYQASKRQAG